MVTQVDACNNGHLVRAHSRRAFASGVPVCMSIIIRDVREHELDSVLALNNAAGSTILPLDAISVRKFYDEAAYFRVAAAEDHLAGFLIGLRENADYASDNFLWFRERYP